MNLEAMTWADNSQFRVLPCGSSAHLVCKPEQEAAVQLSQCGKHCGIGQRLTDAVPPAQHEVYRDLEIA